MRQIIVAIIVMLAIVPSINAQINPVNEQGLAIGGYDLVAYFDGEAKPGFAAFSTEFEGATYQFSTKVNLEKFTDSPSQYLPQFEGYCAWGIATQQSKLPINPETFDIVDGKLYLFFNGPFKGEAFNTLVPWHAETTKLVSEGQKHWQTVK